MKPPRILVVDDEPGIRQSLCGVLEDEGYQTQSVESSEACLVELARELYDSNQAPGGRDQFGSGIKFATPTIANGRVFVGAATGVAVFGRRP